MRQNGFMGFILTFSSWMTDLVYLNILWILFSSFGLLVIGFFPATFAMFSIIRLLLNDKEEVPIFKSFVTFYTRDFLKSNLIGWVVSIILIIFYFDINFIKTTTNGMLQLFYYPIIILAIMFCLVALYVIPTYIHFKLTFVQLFKNSLLIMILNPLNTITMVSSIGLIIMVSIFFPIIIPLFSGSVLALFIMITALRSYKKVEDKKEKLEILKY